MAKKLSTEQIKMFLQNLATALIPGSSFALWVTNTAKKNKFTAVLLPKDYAPHHFLSIVTPNFLIIDPSYNEELPINGLDSFLKNASPQLMLRPNQAVKLDWIIETFKCDSNELCQLVLRSIRNKANAILKERHSKEFNVKAIDKMLYKNENDALDIKTPNLKSMEELYVWADLHAN